MGKIVLLGNGRVRRVEAMTLIEDYVEAQQRQGKKVQFIFPLLSERDDSVPAITAHTYRWTRMADVPFGMILPVKNVNKIDTLVAEMMSFAAVDTVDADFPVRRAVKGLDPAEDVVIIAWDDDDHSCAEAARLAHRLGIKALDLTAQLEEIEWEEAPNDESDDAGKSEVLTLTTVEEASDEGVIELPEALVHHLVGLVDALADLVLQKVTEKLSE